MIIYILAIDESNVKKQKPFQDFFVVGGLLIPSDRMKEITDKINEILTIYEFTTDNELKYNDDKYPQTVKDTPGQVDNIRNELVDVICHSDAILIFYLVAHDILDKKNSKILITQQTITNKKQNQINGELDVENLTFGINTIISKTNEIMGAKKEICITLIDKHDRLEPIADTKLLNGLFIKQNQSTISIRHNIISVSTAASHGSFAILRGRYGYRKI